MPSFEPAPAVSITGLDRKFLPGHVCTLKYELEGPNVRANKLDLEVHALRYYKDAVDKEAEITLGDFHPVWKSQNNASPVLEDTSLKVSWEIKNDNNKLKYGQLIISDDENAEVFRMVLDEQMLSAGKKSYDLVNGAVKIDKARITRDKMPFRVQIQAHSGTSEENGNALAALNTAVKPYAYTDVQFIGLNIRPYDDEKDPPRYLGDDDDATDIAKRCDILKKAIRIAQRDANTEKDDESVLRVFMAPEFYFRGPNGGYP